MEVLNREYEKLERELNSLVSNWDWFEKTEKLELDSSHLIDIRVDQN
ncbi:MAG: hypothetical protein PWQ96_211 [Clostridia bacterium]|jgi:hypothetical protein|nr:hypothetical protein [Clostridiales bacterium]MDK2984569.1 hypothetical protein [Clostridia bacterium]